MKDSLEAGVVDAEPPAAAAVADANGAWSAAQKDLDLRLREILHRPVEIDLELLADGSQKCLMVLGAEAAPGKNRPFLDGEPGIGDDEGFVQLVARPEPRAIGTGAVGRIEGEEPGLKLLEAALAVEAGVALAEGHLLARAALLVERLDEGDAAADAERQLHGIGETLARAGPHDDAVHDDLDGVLLVAGELDVGGFGDVRDGAVDADAGEALPADVLEYLAVLALAAAHDGAEDEDAGGIRQLQHLIDDLLRGLLDDGAAALGAVGLADARPEEPHVVVDFGDRGDGGSRIPGRGLLVDGDCGREPLDEVHVGLVHLAEELAGVGGEGLDVSTLSLGIDGVEGQRGFARAGEAGDDDEPIPRDLDGDVLQVVLPRAADDELIGGHPESPFLASNGRWTLHRDCAIPPAQEAEALGAPAGRQARAR